MSDPAPPASTRNPILWGAYLACSWTWCIGMFLPALLLRDMGWAGFAIFAIPNVIGAAAMGWILPARADSVRFVENHPTAVWWFSALTLAFHLFWVLWVANFFRAAFQIPTAYLAGVGGAVAVFLLLSSRALRRNKMPQLAVGLLVVSLGVLVATLFMPDTKEANALFIRPALSASAPLWMLPVMLFGFLLCPYLDITFHHARQQLDTKKNGRLGFSIGFVGFFVFMILLTTRYAGVIVGALDGSRALPPVTPWLAAAILTHMFCQWVFTVRVHLDRIRTIPAAQKKRPQLMLLLLISAGIGAIAIKLPGYAGLSGGEVIYRGFMSAYGLLFPAYMLYRVVLARKGKAPLSVLMMWIAIALASPMFWIGFIERQTIWLIPGMVIVLLGPIARLLRRSGRSAQ
jgi:hypothetical protein